MEPDQDFPGLSLPLDSPEAPTRPPRWRHVRFPAKVTTIVILKETPKFRTLFSRSPGHPGGIMASRN